MRIWNKIRKTAGYQAGTASQIGVILIKSTKDMVFEFVRQYVYTHGMTRPGSGVETKVIAQALGKQRSNISSALNELIKEGKLVKTATRPVLYRLPAPSTSADEVLGTGRVIGEEGSLRTAFQQAKAALRYPSHPLNILIRAKSGCGTTYFVNLIHQYAVRSGILSPDMALVKVDCRHYSKNILALDEVLFGTGRCENSCFSKARGGMLFIDGFDLLDARQQSRIFTFLDTKMITADSGEQIDYSDVCLVLSCAGGDPASLKQNFSIIVELPELSERPLEERFALVNHFFELEARNLKRNVEVTSEAVSALLITKFALHVKELHNEVLKACMNAYVRAEDGAERNLRVGISDFGFAVQRSLLELKSQASQLHPLLGDSDYFLYDEELGYQPRQMKPAEEPVGMNQAEGAKPVLLYVMHGSATAGSLCATTNAVTGSQNAYGFDLDLESDARTAKEGLEATIRKIDRGAGIIVIYDMGSIKTMIDAIIEETGIKICCLQVPITLIGIDAAQKCEAEYDADTVYHSVCKALREQQYHHNPRNSVIITLCHTGGEGANYLKQYIDQYSRLGIKTIAFNISGRRILLREAMELKRTYRIHAFVGTYDPKLLGIPYIPASTLLNVAPKNVDRVLMFEPVQLSPADYSGVYESLQEQLKFTSVAKLKRVLPNVVDELTVMYDLDADRAQSVFIHLAFMVEKILSEGNSVENPQAQKIMEVLAEDCRAVSRILRPLEKTFKIIIDDNAISTLIMILKKI